MGSCEAFQVYGRVELTQSATGEKRIVLALKPTSVTAGSLWKELRAFCDPNDLVVRSSIHSCSLNGSFLYSGDENQLTFTLSDQMESEPVRRASPHTTEKSESVLQYQVDGKIYELKTTLPLNKITPSSQSQSEVSLDILSNKKKKSLTPKKPAQFTVIDNDPPTAHSHPSVEESLHAERQQRASLEMCLQSLQVKLMKGSIIPELIQSGPDTSTFLHNMKELAKLVAPSCNSGQTGCSFRCGQCQEEMTSYFAYIEHAFKHFGSRPYVCNICQSAFASRAVMRHHLDMHGGKAPFECEFCFKKFRNSSHMKQHKLRHTGEKPYSCQHCNKTFAHKNVLKIHVQTHTGEKPCCCDLCGKLFREPNRLAIHLATHSRTDKSLECPTCGKVFKMKGMLKLHQLKAKKCKPPSDNSMENPADPLDPSSSSSEMNVSYKTSFVTAEQESHLIQGLPVEHQQNEGTVRFVDSDGSIAVLGQQQNRHHHLLVDGQHEVTIIEAESLDDGTMMVLPINTYILGGDQAGIGHHGSDSTVLVQFSIDQNQDDGVNEPDEDINNQES